VSVEHDFSFKTALNLPPQTSMSWYGLALAYSGRTGPESVWLFSGTGNDECSPSSVCLKTIHASPALPVYKYLTLF